MLSELVSGVTIGSVVGAWAANVASDWTASLLGATNRQMRRAFRTSERQEALEEAVGLGLMAALDYLEGCHEGAWYDPDWFAVWLRRDEVVDEFSVLLTQDEASLDVALLREEFEAAGLGQQQLGTASFEELVKCMVAGFSMAATHQPLLQEPLKLGLLRQMVERMGALERLEQIEQWVKQQVTVSQEGVTLQKVSQQQDEERNRLLTQLLQELRTGNRLPASLTPDELAVIEQKYRATIVELFETLTFKGISPSGRAIALPLADVYVELKAVAEVPEAADTFSADERRLLLMADEEGVDHAELKMHLDTLRLERWREKARGQSKVLQRRSIHETLSDPSQHGVVILGDPGSGKTTLLHYLALSAAKNGPHGQLPIFVPLAAYDEYLRLSESHVALGEFLAIYYERWRSLSGLGPLFAQALEHGRALLLLDGLDEVLEKSTRQFVANQAEGFIQRWVGQGNRFALTSRIVGYREAPLSNRLPHVTVLDIGPEEIEQFAKQWCYAYESWVESGKRTMVVEQRAEREMALLLADVRSNRSVERLAANPLLLTMLALLRRQVGKLPDRRIELYERYIRTLIDNWEEARSQGARQQTPERVDPHTAIEYLIELAFWLQQNKPSGTARRRELENKLDIICLECEGYEPAKATPKLRLNAQKEAARFLNDMRHFAGLLAERGHDAFGFLHLTFQEYFAGRALARMTEEERQKAINPYLHHPRWREPILLCAGQQGVIEQRRDQVNQMVRWILHANSEHEAILHRDKFLAVAIARDDVGLAPFVLEELAEQLIPLQESKIPTVRDNALAGLAQLAQLNDETALSTLQQSLEESKLTDHVMRALTPVIASDGCAPLRKKIVTRLSDPDLEIRKVAVQALAGMVGQEEIRQQILARFSEHSPKGREAAVQTLAGMVGQEEVRQQILACLSDPYYYIREAAAEVLAGELTEEEIRQEILPRLSDDDPNVREAAVQVLAGVMGQEEIRQQILACLSDPDYLVRQTAVEVLAGMVGQEEIRQQILAHLSDDDPNVRQTAVETLAGVVGQEEIRQEILACLSDYYDDVRLAAVEALAGMVGQEEICQQILACLSDNEWYVREAAVLVLAGVAEQEEIRQQILARLSDPDNHVRLAAVQVLAGFATEDKFLRRQIVSKLKNLSYDIWERRAGIVEALAGVVRQEEICQEICQEILPRLSDPDYLIRLAAMETLAGMEALVVGQEEIHQEIRACLSDYHADVRRATVEALADMVGQEEIRQEILARLSDDEWYVRRAAVEALAGMVEQEEIRQEILARLSDDDPRVRLEAVNALTPYVGQEEIRQEIRARLSDDDPRVRLATVKVLAPYVGQEEIRQKLLARLSDPDYKVREAAVKALAGVVEQEEIRQQLLARLSDPDYEVREAAIKALAGVVEQKEIRQQLLARLSDPDYELRKMVVDALAAHVGQEEIRQQILARLSDDEWYVRRAAVEALAGVVGQEEIRQEILAHLSDDESYVRMAAVKALASYVGQEEIRQEILARLSDDNLNVRRSAVKALASYVGQEEICQPIMARLSDSHYLVRMAAVKALASYVGQEEIRQEILARLSDDNLNVRRSAVKALAAHVGQEEIRQPIMARLSDDNCRVRWAAVEALAPYVGQEEIRQAVLARLSDDDCEIREMAVEALAPLIGQDQTITAELLGWLGFAIETHYTVKAACQFLADAYGPLLAHDPVLFKQVVEMLDSVSWVAREGAARALIAMPSGPPAHLMPKLRALIHDNRAEESWPERLQVAELLINDRDYELSQQAINVTLKALDFATEPWYYMPELGRDVREQAAQILGQLEPLYRDEKIFARLARVLEEDEDEAVRDAAYGALLRLAAAPER